MDSNSGLENKIHIRRCHICGTVNEQENASVRRCNSCGKALAPFMFFDDKTEVDPSLIKREAEYIDLEDSRLKSGTLYQHLKSQYPPLWGIAVYW